MTDELRQKYLGMEKIEIGGRKYFKDSLSSTALKDEINKTGSFINILANSLRTENIIGKNIKYVR